MSESYHVGGGAEATRSQSFRLRDFYYWLYLRGKVAALFCVENYSVSAFYGVISMGAEDSADAGAFVFEKIHSQTASSLHARVHASWP